MRALKIKSDDVEAFNNKGVTLFNLSKYDESIQWYDKVLKINPDYEVAIKNKQLAQTKLGKDKG